MGAIRRRGRRFDPAKLRLVLREKYGHDSISAFADLIENKRLTTPESRRRLPSRGAVFAFCRGDRTDKRTWQPQCEELRVDASLIEEADFSNVSSDADQRQVKTHWSFCHPAPYSGQVWIQLEPKRENRGKAHRYIIRWGPWAYSGAFTFGRQASVSLLHMKGNANESVPLFLSISPPCSVIFGQGDPRAGAVQDVNHGWSRVEVTAAAPAFQ